MRLRDHTTRRVVILAAVGALVVATLAVPALARNASDDATAEPSAGAAELDGRVADHHAAFAEALAEELDLPVERVEEAVTAVHERLTEQRRQDRGAALRERLDDAVADGRLTREQADAILDGVEAGVLPDGPGSMRGMPHGQLPHRGMGGPHMWFGAPDDAPPSDGS